MVEDWNELCMGSRFTGGKKNGRERDRLRFVEASVPSPYIEVSMTDLNIREPEGTRWEINPPLSSR